jgi:outer membrane protein
MTFADHHQFTARDIRRINKQFAQLPSPKTIITTEKDAVRLMGMEGLSDEVKSNIYQLPIRIRFMLEQEEEFNKKYEEFLEGQTTFAPAIYSKRQSELQELMEKNIAFKQEARRLLNDAEAAAIIPLKERLNGAIEKIAKERGFAFVLNTDGDACPYINPAMGVNIEDEVISKLNVTR